MRTRSKARASGNAGVAIEKGQLAMLAQEVRSPFAGTFHLKVQVCGEATDREWFEDVLLKQFTAPEQGRTVAWYTESLERETSVQGGGNGVPDTSARMPALAGTLPVGTGIWRDAWFGEVAIGGKNGGVRFRAAKSPLLSGTVGGVGDR